MATKKESPLRTMGKSGKSRPVDSTTKRVLGVCNAKRRTQLAKQIQEARARLAELTDERAKFRLEATIRDLEFRMKYGGGPAIGPSAERSARRALARAAARRFGPQGNR